MESPQYIHTPLAIYFRAKFLIESRYKEKRSELLFISLSKNVFYEILQSSGLTVLVYLREVMKIQCINHVNHTDFSTDYDTTLNSPLEIQVYSYIGNRFSRYIVKCK